MSEKLSERTGVKIVILGSLRNGDYVVTVPYRVRENYHNEEGYQEACKRFYPAIDEANVVIVYGDVGEHTQRDIDYAISKGKKVIRLNDVEALESENENATNALDKAHVDLQEILASIKELKSERDTLENACETHESINLLLNGENKQLIERAESAEAKVKAQTQIIDDCNKTIEGLKLALNQSKSRLLKAQEHLSELSEIKDRIIEGIPLRDWIKIVGGKDIVVEKYYLLIREA